MPTTIRPSPDKVGRNSDPIAVSEAQLFHGVTSKWDKDVRDADQQKGTKPVLHSSFKKFDAAELVIPYGNGFVDGVIRAFQQDLHLVLRPDDVWLSIITQFSFYVAAHAAELRSKFVKHEGKEKLVVFNKAPFWSWDVGMMAEMFLPLMQEKMTDQEVQTWLLPKFSTTTKQDSAVNSMVMMATMKEYFIYIMRGGCGFPSVTLLGEAADWQMILDRLGKFAEYGEEPTAWSKLLKPVIKRFIATFYLPDSTELKDFWMRAVHAAGKFGSGPAPTFDGWLTSFMYWGKEGHRADTVEKHGDVGSKRLVLDGEVFPTMRQNTRGVPVGVVEVPVIVETLDLGIRFDTRIVAGSMGMTVSENEKDDGSMVQPCSGWWMLEYGCEPLFTRER